MHSEKFIKEFFASRNHQKGMDYINHFSTAKAKYKASATAIVGAFLAALSFIVRETEETVHIDKIYFILISTIILILGLNLIRFLDVNVSHEQIRMLFKKIIELEENEKVAQPYRKIAKHLYSKLFDPVLVDFLYYGSINIGVIIFGIVLLSSKIQSHHNNYEIVVPFLLLMFFFIKEIFGLVQIFRKRLKFF